MCGIAGYIGKQQAAPIILDGLSKLEYRGYDSAGIAVFDGQKIHMEKAVGRLRVLDEKINHGTLLPGFAASDTPAGRRMAVPLTQMPIPI